MKKILLSILTIGASFAFNSANAQWCGTVSNCSPNPTQATGFPSSDSIPCITQGEAYNYAIPFKMYETFTFAGMHNIDSIRFDTIYNLPCGMCWSLNKASRTYSKDEFGCLNISGTTADAVGQYNLRFAILAYLSDGGGQPVGPEPPGVVDQAGIKVWLRVNAVNGTCVAVNTSGANRTANPSCAGVGINEVAANVASIEIMPNPMNSSATLSFVAEKSASYTVRITDITGKLISVKQMEANAGINTTSIERGNLSAGIYLLSLSDGASSVTRKFTIAQ